MKKTLNYFIRFKFFRFSLVGGISTIVDWSLFYLLTLKLNLFYQSSLILASSAGAIVNYSFNKIFTFQCNSKKIAKQFSLFFTIAILSLIVSIFIMYFFVSVMNLEKMTSRMITTGIIVILNYFFHKNLTFNKKIFS